VSSRGADHRLGAAELRQEDLAVGVLADPVGDLALERVDLRGQLADGGHEREHDGAASFDLLLAGASPGTRF
jgi:hypothetical protein